MILPVSFLRAAGPIVGTTTFDALFPGGAGPIIGPAPGPLTAGNAGGSGWDFTFTAPGSPGIVITSITGGAGVGDETDFCIRMNTGGVAAQSAAVKSNNSATFHLTSVYFKFNSADGATNITLTGYRSGVPVSGATKTLNIPSVTWTQFDVSSISAFSNIDQFVFTQAAPASNTVTFMVVDNITITSLTPLPLTLIDFSGLRNDNKVQLQWTTGSEENTANFEVQRAGNGADFAVIGRVQAAGNSKQTLHYNYTDLLPAAGAPAYLYRLKLADLDGRFTYSPILKIGTASSGPAVSVYPNPYQQQLVLTVNASEAEKAQLIVTDMSGKVLQRGSLSLQKGANSFPLTSMTRLNKGIYLLHITTSKQRQTLRVVKTE